MAETLTKPPTTEEFEELLKQGGLAPHETDKDWWSDEDLADQLIDDNNFKVSSDIFTPANLPEITSAVLNDEEEPLLEAGEPQVLLESGLDTPEAPPSREPLHASSIHEKEGSLEAERERIETELRTVANEVIDLSRAGESGSEEGARKDAQLGELFKQAEAAGVNSSVLEFFAKYVDESLEYHGKHVAGVESPRETAETDGIDDETSYGEPVAAAEAYGHPTDEQVAEVVPQTNAEKLRGWWNKNRESLKKPFGLEYWAERWEGLAEPYKNLSAKTASYFTDVVRDLQYGDEDRLLKRMTVEELEPYREKRRKRVMIGLGALAATSIGAGLIHGVHDLMGSGASDAAAHLRGHGVGEALAGGAPAPHETISVDHNHPIPDGVTIEQGPSDSHMVQDSLEGTSTGSNTEGTNIGPEFRPSNATLGNEGTQSLQSLVQEHSIMAKSGYSGTDFISDMNKQFGTHFQYEDWKAIAPRLTSGTTYVNQGGVGPDMYRWNHQGLVSNANKLNALQVARELGRI